MPRQYSLETYSSPVDLDGFPLTDAAIEVGSIVSLTLIHDKPTFLTEIDGRKVLGDPLSYYPREEAFFQITKLISDTHYEVTFYDFYGKEHVHHLAQEKRCRFTTHLTAEEHREVVSNEYYEKLDSAAGQDNWASYQSRTKMWKAMQSGEISIAEVVKAHHIDMGTLRRKQEAGEITLQQFQEGRLVAREQLRPLKEERRRLAANEHAAAASSSASAAASSATPSSSSAGSNQTVVDEVKTLDGLLDKSRWLRTGTQITCHRNNLHYLPLSLNQNNSQTKPYHYSFRAIPPTEITDWNGRLLERSILGRLLPGDWVRCCFDVVKTATSERIGGGAWYFRIVKIDDDKVLGEVGGQYYSPEEYGLKQQFGNLIGFRLRNVSEIPLSWNKHLNDFKGFVKSEYGISTGSRGGNVDEGVEYDISH